MIDGQQRLRSLLYFYQGKFPNSRHSFALKGVHTEFEKETYKSLKDAYRRQLDDSVVSATVVEPLYANDESSIYYIFERLNTGGTILKPQEIRACIYHGELNNLLGQLNKNPAWRDIFGLPDKNGKDQELILRFLAFYFDGNDYKPSLKEFLNQYMSQNRHLARQSKEQIINAFIPTIEVIQKGIGNKAFKPQKLFIPTYFEAVMVVTARRLQQGKINNLEQLGERYKSLIEDNNFSGVAQKVRNLTSLENVMKRLEIASYHLGNLE
ncbi:GmrSD restriction endonuclease domain-containing protein [Microcoleus vaginatus]|uniref:GmrSD restriction endonuclease domain-containing protein n=1 Tax=Microcoleus vaginatus TaxID=119532 RepID=UPI00403FBC74